MDDRYHYLQAFIAVGDTLSFSKAAKLIGISQPTISRQIKMLEDQLKCSLVMRNTHAVVLTSQGRELYDKVRPAFQNLLENLLDIERQSHELAGVIRVGTLQEIGQMVVMDLVLKFQKQHPKIRFHLKYQKTAETHERLQNGQLDFAITAIPFTTESIQSHPLFYEEAVVVTRKQNTLLEERTDDTAIPFVIYRDDDTLIEGFLRKIKRIKPQQILPLIIVNSQSSMVKALLATDAYAIMPYHSVAAEIKAGKLKVAAETAVRNRFYLSFHGGGHIDAKCRAFKEFFTNSSSELRSGDSLVYFKDR